jgi:alkylation response protein AidB-like acyl-CoA dehydrogenase
MSATTFDVPEHVRPIRERVRRFIEERIYPVEHVLDGDAERAGSTLRGLIAQAKAEGLWALATPRRSVAAACRSSTTCTSTR